MIQALHIALQEYGTREVPGTGSHNPEVVKYFQQGGFPTVRDDETSWCSAFMNWCVKKAGGNPTGSLSARSWLNWGRPVVEPELGDIVVFWRRDPKGWEGHVGFFIKRDGTHVWVLGGNQSNEVNIQKYPGTELLGYRRLEGDK
ncbi:MAG TPA: TIGR02594 family protein [Prolixibacteraceae bacterium]|nr:TIGR02594 family protein [Prolixibacteraceae bacterium]